MALLLQRSPRRTRISSQGIEASGNGKERQESAHKKRRGRSRSSLLEQFFYLELWFLFAKEATELVDGVRSTAFAAAGERTTRVGDPARSPAADAGKLGLEKASRCPADVRDELRAG